MFVYLCTLYNTQCSNTIQWYSSSRKLVILFVVIAAAVIVLRLGVIVSVVHSIVLSKGLKPFMWDVTRAATWPTPYHWTPNEKITDYKCHPWIKLHPTSWIKQNTLKAKISIRTSQTRTAFLNVFIVWLQATERSNQGAWEGENEWHSFVIYM